MREWSPIAVRHEDKTGPPTLFCQLLAVARRGSRWLVAAEEAGRQLSPVVVGGSAARLARRSLHGTGTGARNPRQACGCPPDV